MHQFKVSGLNSVHLICDSYQTFKHIKPEFEIGIANQVCTIQTTYLELMHSHPNYFLLTQY